MRFRLRTLLIVLAGIMLILLGLGCLNYTKVDGLQHHMEFAQTHGLPKPGEHILLAGAASLLAGAGLVGYSIGSRNSS
jgi:sulfite exporter TauE/SafE